MVFMDIEKFVVFVIKLELEIDEFILDGGLIDNLINFI